MFLFPTIYSKFVFFFFFFFFFYLTRLVKIHGFSKCTENSHGLYGEKSKLRPYIETKLQFFTWFIWRRTFLQDFLRYTNKINGVSIFLVFHTVLWTTVFHPILLFLLNKALLIIVWNNLDSNSVEY